MDQKRSSDIDLLTLVIAAAAGAVAAYLTSKVWAGGTLVTAAMTPVIVALVKEALARPVDAVTGLRTERRPPGEENGGDPSPLHPPVTVHGSSKRRWIRVGIVSGLAAFALIVAVFTIPELVAGKSIGRDSDSATTLFGGKERKSSSEDTPKDTNGTSPGATATAAPEDDDAEPTPAPSASFTPTPAPTASATPTVTATPTPSPAP